MEALRRGDERGDERGEDRICERGGEACKCGPAGGCSRLTGALNMAEFSWFSRSAMRWSRVAARRWASGEALGGSRRKGLLGVRMEKRLSIDKVRLVLPPLFTPVAVVVAVVAAAGAALEFAVVVKVVIEAVEAEEEDEDEEEDEEVAVFAPVAMDAEVEVPLLLQQRECW